MRSYLAHATQFASGAQNPRDFLEACLANLNTWEPKVGAFVNLNIEGARQAADRATARWCAGAPLSPIDGMPIGIKDIIETADMPTEMGSPLFAGWRSQKDAASVTALRQASGMISAGLGTQVIGSTLRPASFCGCVGFKPTVGALNREGSHDYQSQSCTGILGATLQDTWQVAYEIAQRVGGDAGTPGLTGPDKAPGAVKPRRVACLRTAGWDLASEAAKARMQDALQRLSAAGVEIRTGEDDADVSAIDTELAEAFSLSNRINSFETRWFINGCAERDATLLSKAMLDRREQAKAMTLADYRGWLKERTGVRALYAELADSCDACVTLSAPGPAPAGLQSTGSPQFAVPASLLGVPALSLPVFMLDGLPLGLQLLGFANADATAFATAAWLMAQLGGERAT